MGQRHWVRAFVRLTCSRRSSSSPLLPSALTQAQGTAVFSRIDVAGNQRIEADTVRVFAGIEPGQSVTPEQLNLAVRRLFDTGLFEDVTVMPEAGRLVITVVENPTINQIAIEGNDASTTRSCSRRSSSGRGWPSRSPPPRPTPSASSTPTASPGASPPR